MSDPELVFSYEAASEMKTVPPPDQTRIMTALDRLVIEPHTVERDIRKLADLPGGYRLRVGDWRVVFQVDEQLKRLVVVSVGTR